MYTSKPKKKIEKKGKFRLEEIYSYKYTFSYKHMKIIELIKLIRLTN